MGATETAELMGAAEDKLIDARDCTGIEIGDVQGYVLMLGIGDDIDTLIQASSRSWESDWDGPSGLAGGEAALAAATELLAKAASDEASSGIAEVQAKVATATELAEKARAAFGEIDQARDQLVAHLTAARQEVDRTAELAQAAASELGQASEAAEAALEQAGSIAAALYSAVG